MKFILFSLFLFYFVKLQAQADTILPWEIQFVMGAAIPINLENENAVKLSTGRFAELSVNYHFSKNYFTCLKLNYAKHDFSDIYSLNAYPVLRSHYFVPMIGKFQNFNKFYYQAKVGFGMLYARSPAYLSQKIDNYYIGKSSDESRTFIGECNFLGGYNFNEHLSLILNTSIKCSEIRWDIRYNTFTESDLGLEYVSTGSYREKIIYFPVSLSVGVAYRL